MPTIAELVKRLMNPGILDYGGRIDAMAKAAGYLEQLRAENARLRDELAAWQDRFDETFNRCCAKDDEIGRLKTELHLRTCEAVAKANRDEELRTAYAEQSRELARLRAAAE